MRRPSGRLAQLVAVALLTSAALARAETLDAPEAAAPPPVASTPLTRDYGGRCNGLPIESLQRRLHYREGAPIPPCYRVGRRPRLGFLIAGGSLFLLGYGSAVAYTFNDRRLGALYVPLAGPTIADARLDADEVNESDLQMFGSWQLMGVAITALGVALQNRALIRDDLFMLPAHRRLGRGKTAAASPEARGPVDLRWSFSVGPSTPGLGFGGRF